jgi:anti-anti-sigma regulatory factor
MRVEKNGRSTIICIEGRADVSVARDLWERALLVLSNPVEELTIDLSKSAKLDGAMVQLLFALRKATEERGAKLTWLGDASLVEAARVLGLNQDLGIGV